MREIVAERDVVETIRKVIVNCIRDNKCEGTQIWLSDEVVQKIKELQIYGTSKFPYEGYTMAAFKLKSGEPMEITYSREKSLAIKNWHNNWSNMNIIKFVYFPNSEEYFFFGATKENILVIK